MTRRSPFGPWMKLYVSCLDAKAHYTDEQFRALVETWMHAVRQPVRGVFANRSALDRRIGRPLVDFMLSEGDLELRDDGTLTPHRWDEYQSGVLSTERKKPSGEPVDSSRTAPEQFENSSLVRARAGDSTLYSLGTELPTPETESDPPARTREGEGFDESDPFDAFYLITLQYPNSPRLKSWIREVAAIGPSSRDFFVVLKGEFEKTHDVPSALKATKAKLGQMADRVAAAKAKEPKPVDPLQAEISAALAASGAYAEPDPAVDVEAGRKLQEAFKKNGGGGIAAAAAAVVGSSAGGPSRASRSPSAESRDGESAEAAG